MANRKKSKEEIPVDKALDLLEQKYASQRDKLKKRHVGAVVDALRYVMARDDFNNIWSQKWISLFNGHPSIIRTIKNAEEKAIRNYSSPESANWQAKFEVKIIMVELIGRLCRVSELSDRSKLKVYLTLRQRLALDKDEQFYRFIDDYHKMLQTLVKKDFNIGADSRDIYAYLILRLIAIDGVIDARADLRISHLTADQVFPEEFPFIYVRSGLQRNGKHEQKQYCITDKTLYWLKILSQRAKCESGKGYLYSEAWRKSAKFKKAVRRKVLNSTIEKLWYRTFPVREFPENFDISSWIKMAQISFEILGMPYMCIANMRNQIRGAQIPSRNRQESQRKRKHGLSVADLNGRKLIIDIQRLFKLRHEELKARGESDSRSELKATKAILSKDVEALIKDASAYSTLSQSTIDNAKMFIWLLNDSSFDDLTLSTIMSHTYTIRNRVLLDFDIEDPRHLSKRNWGSIAQSIAEDDDYSSSSRITSLTHLRRFHSYLQSVHLDVPDIEWGSYDLRVSRAFSECPVIFPNEVDSWISRMPAGSSEWFAGVIGFYAGLRCEEVFALTPLDFADDIRLTVDRSKRDTSRRTIPWQLLLPVGIYNELKVRVERHAEIYGEGSPLVDPHLKMDSPSTLSKAVGRSMNKSNLRSVNMHALRHGFASWMFIRYYMLTDQEFKTAFLDGEICPAECDVNHPWYKDNSLADLALIIGGMPWYHDFKKNGLCRGRSIDLALISKLLGHNSRFTTIESYSNSLQWIQRYYMNTRLECIQNARWSF